MKQFNHTITIVGSILFALASISASADPGRGADKGLGLRQCPYVKPIEAFVDQLESDSVYYGDEVFCDVADSKSRIIIKKGADFENDSSIRIIIDGAPQSAHSTTGEITRCIAETRLVEFCPRTAESPMSIF